MPTTAGELLVARASREDLGQKTVHQFGGGEGARVVARQVEQLDDIEGDDPARCRDESKQRVYLVPVEPSGLRRAGRRHHARIEAIHVDRHVHVFAQESGGALHPGPGPGGILRSRPLGGDLVREEDTLLFEARHLRRVEASDADLHDRAALPHASHHAGMVVGGAAVRLARVRVGVDLEHGESRHSRRRSSDRPHGHGMLAAQHDRQLAIIQDLSDPVLDGVGQRVGRPVDLHRRERRDPVVVRLRRRFDIPHFHVVGGGDEGRGPTAGTLHPAARRIVGDGQDAGGGPLGITVLGREIEEERVGACSTGAARLGARLRFGVSHASNLRRTPVAVTGCERQMPDAEEPRPPARALLESPIGAACLGRSSRCRAADPAVT